MLIRYGVKTDRSDVQELRAALPPGPLQFVRPPSAEQERWRDLVRGRDDIPHVTRHGVAKRCCVTAACFADGRKS